MPRVGRAAARRTRGASKRSRRTTISASQQNERNRQQDLRDGDRELQRAGDAEQRHQPGLLEPIAVDPVRRVEREGVVHGLHLNPSFAVRTCQVVHIVTVVGCGTGPGARVAAASTTCAGLNRVRQRKSPGSQTR